MKHKIYIKEQDIIKDMTPKEFLIYLKNQKPQGQDGVSEKNIRIFYSNLFSSTIFSKKLNNEDKKNNVFLLESLIALELQKKDYDLAFSSSLFEFKEKLINENFEWLKNEETTYPTSIKTIFEEPTMITENKENNNGFIYSLREIDIKTYQEKIQQMTETELKNKFKKNYSISPLFLSALNKDPKVLELTIYLYKKLNLDLNNAIYIKDLIKNKTIVVKNDRYHLFNEVSIFDVCMAYEQKEQAKILLDLGLNKNKIKPFDLGGVFYYLSLNQKSSNNYKEKVCEHILNFLDYDKNPENIFQCNFFNYINYHDYYSKRNFDYLKHKNFLNTEKKQVAFLSFLNLLIDIDPHFINPLSNKPSIYFLSQLSVFFFENIGLFKGTEQLKVFFDKIEEKNHNNNTSEDRAKMQKKIEQLKIIVEKQMLKNSISSSEVKQKFKI